jgi:hypothetical protein
VTPGISKSQTSADTGEFTRLNEDALTCDKHAKQYGAVNGRYRWV